MTDKSRAEFEAFARRCNHRLDKYEDGNYTSSFTADSWRDWQASRRAAIEGLSLTDAEIDVCKKKATLLSTSGGVYLDENFLVRAIIAALKEKAK